MPIHSLERNLESPAVRRRLAQPGPGGIFETGSRRLGQMLETLEFFRRRASTPPGDTHGRLPPGQHPVLAVQRLYGNQAAGRFAAHLASAHDPAEAEADRLARSALRQGEAPVPVIRPGPAELVDPDLARELHTARSGGRPLPANLLASFENAYEADFSEVRLHTGPQAAGLNRRLNSQAFTAGRHIYFAQGTYAPDQPAGSYALAHELAHVLQEQAAGLGADGLIIQRLLSGDELKAKHPEDDDPLLEELARLLDEYAELINRFSKGKFEEQEDPARNRALLETLDRIERQNHAWAETILKGNSPRKNEKFATAKELIEELAEERERLEAGGRIVVEGEKRLPGVYISEGDTSPSKLREKVLKPLFGKILEDGTQLVERDKESYLIIRLPKTGAAEIRGGFPDRSGQVRGDQRSH